MHQRLLPPEALASVERANEWLERAGTSLIPSAAVNSGLLYGALGEPFRTNVLGEQLFRTIGEKAAVLAYTLIRASPFPRNNTLAATVIFSAFLEKNRLMWDVPREEFLPSLNAMKTWGPEEWERPTSWLTELGIMADWITERISPLPDFDGLEGLSDAP